MSFCRLFLCVSVVAAADLRAELPLEISLVSEVKSIIPGQTFYVGLALHHGSGYHTYWKHPGIVGVPTNIQWMGLPKGFKADPIDWPEPEPVKMFQIKAQGYERDVVLPIKITPPADLVDGAIIKLVGKASWMCCNRECNPGFKDLSIEIPVRKAVAQNYDAKWHPKFDVERALRPKTSASWIAKASSKEKRIIITLRPSEGAATITAADAAKIIFFTDDGLVDSDKPQEVERLADGSLRFGLVEAEFIVGERSSDIRGVLLNPSGWEHGGRVRCLRVTTKLEALP